MTEPAELPYGSWPSPITAASLVVGAASVGEVRADGGDVWWSEARPEEGGRTQLVRRSSGGARHDLFPAWVPGQDGPAWNARTAVLEYGGGAWGVHGRTVVFANWADQRLYRTTTDPDDVPVPITPEPATPRGFRWSEPTWLDQDLFPGWIVCVREAHEGPSAEARGEAANELVALPLDGSAVEDASKVVVLATGADFVHSPTVSGDRVAFIRWDHPRMPWEGTELVLATIEAADGVPTGTVDELVVAGGPEESIVQPGFTAVGDLVFLSDRTGWWAPYRACEEELPRTPHHRPDPSRARPDLAWGIDGRPPQPAADPVLALPVEAEIGGPLWVGGLRWWTELPDGRLVVVVRANATDALGVIETNGRLTILDSPFTEVEQVVLSGDGRDVLVVAGTPVEEPAPYLVGISARAEGDLGNDDPESPADDSPTVILERLKPPAADALSPRWISVPEHVEFPSADGRTAHALWYPPHNPEAGAPEGERPPLVVMIHGGPTSAVRHVFSRAKQFWTSRGFGVVDVDYGGSTGYGRPYRQLLEGRWGIVDVEDAVAAATYLAAEGKVDGDRLAIRGGSAGGYTTLASLCFHDAFKAGCSLFGVADLSALAADTHKFESRYLDSLVGPWPEARATYEARSPIHHTDGFSAPLLVLQGSEDEVVPPNQAEMIVAALAAKGIPHAYVLFEGEQHGFRQAPNIIRSLEAELWFYGRVFGFEPADQIEPVAGAVGL